MERRNRIRKHESEVVNNALDDETTRPFVGLLTLVPESKNYTGPYDDRILRKATALSDMIREFVNAAWRYDFSDDTLCMNLSAYPQKLREIFCALLDARGWDAGLVMNGNNFTGWAQIFPKEEVDAES